MNKTIVVLLLSVMTLLVLGVVTLFSSMVGQTTLQRLGWQACWIALGMLCGAGCALIPYTLWRNKHRPAWLLAISAVLLLAVLIPGVGVAKNGAHRWLAFGQPSEFAKVALVLFLAHYGASSQGRMRERNVGFVWPGLIAGGIVLLVFAEPDWGTASLSAVITLAMLAIAGARWAYLLSAAVISFELFALLLLRNPLRLERVLAFLNPEAYRSGIGWQAWHSVLALGSGGLFGTYFGEGAHKNGFVPEQQTDFVLSLIGEELGFAGTLLVLLLFAVIVLCGARIAWRVVDPFGQLLASGLTLLIGVQAFINIGVVTSSLPNKGIALPFVSYGGSNLICMLACIGLLVSVARHGPLRPAPQIEVQGFRSSRRIGPVGSLLDDPARRKHRRIGQRLAVWMHLGRSRFPVAPMHSYQRPPRAADI